MNCRFCNAQLSTEFVNLGMQPPSNRYISPKDNLMEEHFFPLITYVCNRCKLVQTLDFSLPEELFTKNYAYFSSFSTSWLDHCYNYVKKIIAGLELGKSSQVVEVASNDGYLLQYFKEHNIPCLGIEPCQGVANVAIDRGIDTRVAFFGKKLAETLPQADLVIGNNVLAHVPDINDFIEGVGIVLKTSGTVTFEFPSLLNLITNNQFDTIYHEHYSYLSLTFVKQLLEHHGLMVYDVEDLSTHGGSLRVYGCHAGIHSVSDRVKKSLDREKCLQNIETYQAYSEIVRQTKCQFLEILIHLKKHKKSIISYGAAAKGNTLFNYCGIRSDFIEYAVDLNPAKQGLFLPGVHIPIYSPDRIKETRPDYILITPWNIENEIRSQLEYVREWNCQFIVAIPQAKIL